MTATLAVAPDPFGTIPLTAVPPASPAASEPPPRETLALVSSALRSGSLAMALQSTAENLRRWVGCDTVVVHLPPGASAEGGMALSGAGAPPERSELRTQIEAVGCEIIARNQAMSCPAAPSAEIAPSLALKSAAELLGVTAVLALPLEAPDGSSAGCWLLAGDSRLLQPGPLVTTLRSVLQPVASALLVVQQAEPGWFQRRWTAWMKLLGCRLPWVIAAAVGLVALALALISVPYRVECKAWIEPAVERYLSAPVDGTLERAYVKPGDEVRAGQILARLHDQDVLALLATLEARVDQSRKRRETALARRQPADAQLADLDLRQAEQELSVARRRQSQLAITSPLDGVVLAGDLQRAEGMPLKIGQTLFQIAPKSPLIIAIAVPERESSLVEPGQTVTAAFDAAPGLQLAGKLNRIHPRAEMRDDQNVFVAEFQIAEDVDGLRPGMRGQAHVQTEYRSLAWILFHRPWQALLDLWPW